MPNLKTPNQTLKTIDMVSLIVGTVLGAGIFKVPSLVAGQLPNDYAILTIWLIGGLISIVGALCYVELATSYPNVGGEYYFLQLAFGKKLAFLYGWARSTVIVTGSLGLLGFTLGDYLSQIIQLGQYSSSIWACVVIVIFSFLNAIGIKEGKNTQNLLTLIEVLGVIAIIITGFYVGSITSSTEVVANTGAIPHAAPSLGAASLALVFVLLTYGGWNEAAYISAEAIDQKNGVRKALIYGLGSVTCLYLLVNLALLSAFGVQKMGQSSAIASDLFAIAFGTKSSVIFSLIVVFSCLNSINATIIFGSRSTYALGQDWKLFEWVGEWHAKGTPRKAIVMQCVIALILILAASMSGQSFEYIVEFTAPVFWFFILLVGISIFVLRKKYPDHIPISPVPFYPVLPIVFVCTVLWLLWSSIVYSGVGALVGLGILLIGLVVLMIKPQKI